MTVKELDRLSAAAILVTSFTGFPTYVEDVYWDYDAGIRWTTLVTYKDDPTVTDSPLNSYQMLTPKQHSNLIDGDIDVFFDTVRDLCENHSFVKEREER